MHFEDILEQYNYDFPKELIATTPAHPRDSARLLTYNRATQEIHFDTFKNLGKYLQKKTVLVFNETKVIPARITLSKETGGQVELLYIRTTKDGIVGKTNRSLKPGQKLYLPQKKYFFTANKKTEEGWSLSSNLTTVKFALMLKKYGVAPLPPYIKNPGLSEKQIKKEYQTVFAKNEGSVAAPTASLHFTKKLINNLKKSGIKTEYITLHVGLGTFATLTEKNISTKKLHEEYYTVDKKTIARLLKYKKQGYTIIPVGTTALRTLETVFSTKTLFQAAAQNRNQGHTSLFIQEGYKFKFTDGLITNFHVPKSSLLMLVSALTGRENIQMLYNIAVKNKFRLFSFGDGMLII